MTRHLLPALLLAITASASAANPLVSDIFTAEPAVVVDGKRLYLYTGRDEARPGETHETPNGWDDIDPAVFVDDDGQAYMCFGNKVLKYVKLTPNMIELDGPIQSVGLFNFEEAPWLHERDGVYYLSYASGLPEVIAYATGPSPTGPWTYRGVIMDKNKVTHTIHQAFAEFNGKSYVFHHNEMISGADYRRSVAVEEFSYGKDGAIPHIAQTRAGPAANPPPGCNND